MPACTNNASWCSITKGCFCKNPIKSSSVSTAGDVNGDGLDDLIVGAHNADLSGKTDAGKSYVIFGKIGTKRRQ
jgi:hypothetical protein